MQKVITGKTHVFGNNIDTDQIYPGRYLELVDPSEIAKHCLEGARESFVDEFKPGQLVVGGTNFGCGSSREHAAITLKSIGVGAVVAKSFARIFYRNAINLGLPLVVCPEVDTLKLSGQQITIDLENGTVTNDQSGANVTCEPISEYAMQILSYGGIKNMIRAQRAPSGCVEG